MPQQRRASPLFLVGVDSIKRSILDRLAAENVTWHFPVRDPDYFAGLLAERPIRRYFGRATRIG